VYKTIECSEVHKLAPNGVDSSKNHCSS